MNCFRIASSSVARATAELPRSLLIAAGVCPHGGIWWVLPRKLQWRWHSTLL